MTTYLVTRHAGTRNWARAKTRLGKLPFVIDEVIEHLDPERLQAGDVVVGTLPVGVAAQLHKRKIAFWSLDIDVPPQRRGQELSATELAGYKARLTRYEVKERDHHAMAPGKLPAPRKAQPSLTLILVSDQLAPAAIGWLHQRTEQVVLLATSSMKEKKKAAQLQAWFADRAQPPTTKIMDWSDGSYPELLAQSERVATALTVEDRPNVVVNLTGGTKPMSMALQRAFGKRRNHLGGALHGPYVDTERRYILDMLADVPAPAPMRSVLNIGDLLSLQDVEVVSAQSASPGFGNWLQRHELFEILMRKDSSRWLGAWYQMLSDAESLMNSGKNTGSKHPMDATGIQVQWCGSRAAPQFVISAGGHKKGFQWQALKRALNGAFGKALRRLECCDFILEGDQLTLRFNRSQMDELAFARGVWLEVWLARKLSQVDVDDWASSVKVKHGAPGNELDMIAVCGNRMLVAEVKTANLTRQGKEDSKATETVYKFDSLSTDLGRLFKEYWLVSLRAIGPMDLERAKNKSIAVFHGGANDNGARSLAELPQAIDAWRAQCRLERDTDYRRSCFKAP